MKNIKQCAHCTMPLSVRMLDEDHKLTHCTNKKCPYIEENGTPYQRITKVKHMWEKK